MKIKSLTFTSFVCGMIFNASLRIAFESLSQGLSGTSQPAIATVMVMSCTVAAVLSYRHYAKARGLEDWFKAYTNKLLKEWGNKDGGKAQ